MEIEVLDVDKTKDLFSLSFDERYQLFENDKEIIDPFVLDTMFEEAKFAKSLQTIPNVNELIGQYVLSMAKLIYHSNVFGDHEKMQDMPEKLLIVPIVDEIIEEKIKQPKNIRSRGDDVEDKVDFINIKIDDAIKCETKSGKQIVKFGEEVKVHGFRVTKYCRKLAANLLEIYLSKFDLNNIGLSCHFRQNFVVVEEKIYFGDSSAQEKMMGLAAELYQLYSLARSPEIVKFLASGQIAKIPITTVEHDISSMIITEPRKKNKVEEMISKISGIANISYGLSAAIRHSREIVLALFLGNFFGEDSEQFRSAIDDLRSKIAGDKFADEIAKKEFAETYKTNQLLAIIKTQYPAKFAAAANEINKGKRGKNILAVLSKQESANVLLKFEKERDHLRALVANKCDHVNLMRRLRGANKTDKIAVLFDEAKKFVGKTDGGFIKCKVCGFDLACEHYFDKLTLDLSRASYKIVRESLAKYFENNASQNYNCKYCGEIIMHSGKLDDGVLVDENNRMVTDYQDQEDPFYKMIHDEVVNAMKFVQFEVLISPYKYINMVIGMVIEPLFEIEKQINKVKTSSAEEINNKKKLFVIIYVYAAIVISVLNNAKFLKLVGVKEGNAPEYMKFMMQKIIREKSVLIGSLQNISAEYIKGKLTDAFKLIKLQNVPALKASGKFDSYMNILANPAFVYFYNVKYAYGEVKGPIEKSIEHLLRQSPEQLENMSGMFALAKLPPAKYAAEFNAAKELVGFSFPANIAQITIAANYFGFANLFHEIKEGMFLDDVVQPDGTYTESAEKRTKIHDEFDAKNKIVLMHKLFHRAKNNITFPIPDGFRKGSPAISLGRIFDENGKEHKWNKLVFGGEVMSGDDAIRALRAGKQLGQITEKMCSVCGLRRSELAKLDAAKIAENIELRRKIFNFYTYYRNKCLTDGIHTFAAGKCSKCDIKFAYFADFGSNAEAIAFYEKHEVQFAEDTKVVEEIIIPPKIVVGEVSDFGKTYKFDFSKLTQLAKKQKVSIHLLTALGATERQNYAEIESGKFIPGEPDFKSNPRIFRIGAYIHMIFVAMNRIINNFTVIKLDDMTETIFRDAGIEKYEMVNAGSLIAAGPIMQAYSANYESVKKHGDAPLLLNFVLQSFAEIMLEINDGSNKLRENFVRRILDRIIETDSLFAKPGDFSWSIFRDAEVTEKLDLNYDYDAGVATAEELEEGKKISDDFGTTAEMFANDMDIDEADGENENEMQFEEKV